jgi:hypothetical protein
MYRSIPPTPPLSTGDCFIVSCNRHPMTKATAELPEGDEAKTVVLRLPMPLSLGYLNPDHLLVFAWFARSKTEMGLTSEAEIEEVMFYVCSLVRNHHTIVCGRCLLYDVHQTCPFRPEGLIHFCRNRELESAQGKSLLEVRYQVPDDCTHSAAPPYICLHVSYKSNVKYKDLSFLSFQYFDTSMRRLFFVGQTFVWCKLEDLL